MDENDVVASQAQEDFKNTAQQISQPAKALARKGTKAIKDKAAGLVKSAGKKMAKAAVRAGKELVKNIIQCISKLLALLGPHWNRGRHGDYFYLPCMYSSVRPARKFR